MFPSAGRSVLRNLDIKTAAAEYKAPGTGFDKGQLKREGNGHSEALLGSQHLSLSPGFDCMFSGFVKNLPKAIKTLLNRWKTQKP